MRCVGRPSCVVLLPLQGGRCACSTPDACRTDAATVADAIALGGLAARRLRPGVARNRGASGSVTRPPRRGRGAAAGGEDAVTLQRLDRDVLSIFGEVVLR